MRIAIDYRILAGHAEFMGRGIGRFTQMQLREVLTVDRENDYLMVCGEQADLSLVLPEIRAAPNVRFERIGAADAFDSTVPNDPATLLRQSARFQEWVHKERVDLFHATAPFTLTLPVFPHFDACPMIATVYDLIPLVFPIHYLTDVAARETYMRAVTYVMSAQRILAISKATRTDAELYLGFPGDRIDVALPCADSHFQPLTDKQCKERLAQLNRRLRLPAHFVFTVSALHHCKNLRFLFRAYALLPSSLRDRMPLVVACNLGDADMANARDIAAQFGIADAVIFTGFVPDEELVALYNQATVVVHPSRYEGFGLPVVEAMQCGAAVVTTATPALSEVAGDVSWLVDPDDAHELAAAMERLHDDRAAAAAMGRRAIDRARQFDRNHLGEATLAAYRRVMDGSSAAL